MDIEPKQYNDPSIDEAAREFDKEQRRLREEAGLDSSDAINLRERLGVPEGEGTEPREETFESSPTNNIENKELKKAREEYIENYIADSIAGMETEWDQYLKACVNVEQAKLIIAEETEDAIRRNAKDFIEDGSDPNIDFIAYLQVSYFDSPEGRKQYVTGFDINVGNTFKTLPNESEDAFVDDNQAAALDKAEEEGDLKEQKL